MRDGGPSEAVAKVLDALAAQSIVVTRAGSGWSCRCPAHDDHRPSMSIAEGAEGRALLKCHAGCSLAAILEVLELTESALFASKPPLSRRETGYKIRDRHGVLQARHVRVDLPDGTKKFRWEGPDGSTGLGGRRRETLPLYRTEHIDSLPSEVPVILTEGEKACDALVSAGLAAVATVTGSSGCPDTESLDVLRDRSVILWPDNAEDGRSHMSKVGRKLNAIAKEVRVVEWPDAPPKGDAFEYLAAAKGSADRLKEALESAGSFAQWDERTTKPAEPLQDARSGAPTSGASPEQQGHRLHGTQTAQLLGMAVEADLFHTAEGEAFATVPVKDHFETFPVRSRAFRIWLRMAWYRKHGSAPGTQAIEDAIATLEARAAFDGSTQAVYVRVGEHEGTTYLDLGDAKWQAVAIGPFGWQVVSNPPVKFRRNKSYGALPLPVPGGRVDRLRDLLNLGSTDDWILSCSWFMATLRTRGPYPVLVLQGEQGSAKSTAARVFRGLIDPNVTALRCEPSNPEDLLIAARGNWIQAYDNISRLPPWMSDGFCRIATGGGYGTREFYTNLEEVSFDVQRPVLINGIEELATRSDLLDRSLILKLPPIAKEKRRTEEDFWREFEAARAGILGAFLDATSVAKRVHPGVRLPTAPRMADFATWSVACSVGLGWGASAFSRAYGGCIESANDMAIASSTVAVAVIEFMEGRDEWQGSATELLKVLQESTPSVDGRLPDWPKAANALSNRLRRVTPNLRAVGIDVDLDGKYQKKRVVAIRRVASNIVSIVPIVPTAVSTGTYGPGTAT